MNTERAIDMTGRMCGDWTVIERVGSNARGDALWLCQCECGEKRSVTGGSLRNGRSAGCGKGCPARRETAEQIALRFWNQVDLFGADGCWLWTGRHTDNGYGLFYPGAQSTQKYVVAHRWAYEHVVGTIPEGLEIDHLCRVRNCVNPDHLEPVSHLENIRRGASHRAERN